MYHLFHQVGSDLWFLFDIVDSSEVMLFSMSGLENSATHLTRKIEVEVSSFNVFPQICPLAGGLSTVETLPHIPTNLPR